LSLLAELPLSSHHSFLGPRIPLLGRLAIPPHCLTVVLLYALALFVQVTEVKLCPGMPLIGRLAIPP